MSINETFSPGLDGIIVGETAISKVDGDQGKLVYRGHSIEDLTQRSFLHVAYLLIYGTEPTSDQLKALEFFMHEHSEISDREWQFLRSLDPKLHPMLMLQSAVPMMDLSVKSPLRINSDTSESLDGLIIAAKIPGFIAAWHCIQKGQEIHQPSDSDFLTRFLQSFRASDEVTPEHQSILNIAQILQMEHGYNAGTFAGRVCASTQAPIQSVISTSIGTLFGRLHGGADQAALEMAIEIDDPNQARAWVLEQLQAKQKIMGMGHREYRRLDPRAAILKPMAKKVCQGYGRRLYDVLEAVEDACQEIFSQKGKEIHANVEFYKGAVFHELGIPTHYFTAMFAMSRVYGYIAHFVEFQQNARLIRPKARYIGRA